MMGRNSRRRRNRRNRKKNDEDAGGSYDENKEEKKNETSNEAVGENWEEELQENVEHSWPPDLTQDEAFRQDLSTTSNLQTNNDQENETIACADAVSSQEHSSDVTQPANSLQTQTKDNEKTESINSKNNSENYEDNEVLKILLSRLSILLQRAKNRGQLGSVVSELSRVIPGKLSPTAIERCIQWIITQTLSVEKEQLLFLCAALGYFAWIQQVECLPLPNDKTTNEACDKLLDNLGNCAKRNFHVPQNCLGLLWSSAYTIVRGCSNPGWLTFAAHFVYFGEMKAILDVSMGSCDYSKESFLKLYTLAVSKLPSIRRISNYNDKRLFRSFLTRMLQCAPNDDVLFQIFQNQDVRRFFHSENEREQFFLEFYNNSLNNRSGDFIDTLKSLSKIPGNVRYKMSAIIYGYILRFLDTVAEPSPGDLEVILKNLPQQHVLHCLQHLLESQSTNHDLFFQLLNDKSFNMKWEKVAINKRIEVCTSWVKSQVESRENGGKIKATFEAVDVLISCANISSNIELIKTLCEYVVNSLRHEDPVRIIEKFEGIENYSDQVQRCCQTLFQLALYKDPNLLKSKEAINLFKKTSSNNQLMICVLNELRIPDDRGHNTEKVFIEMLKFCDIWIILANSDAESIGKHDSFKAGAIIWQNMEDCILNEEISVSFLHQVEQFQNAIPSILAGLHRNANGKPDEDLRQRCASKINTLVNTEKDVRSKLNLLETAFMFAEKVLSGCGVIPKEIIYRKSRLHTMKMKELNEDFWGPYVPLFKQLNSVDTLMQSVSFINFSKIYVQENDPLNCVTSQDKEIDMDQLIMLFEILATDGISKFEDEWGQVFDNPRLQTVGGLNDLLGDLEGNTIDDEFSYLEKYFGELPPNVKLYITDSLKYSRILTQVKHIIHLLESFEILDSTQYVLVPILTSFMEDFPPDKQSFLRDLHDPMTEVEDLISRYDIDKNDEVIVQLTRSHELIKFLKEIVDEDIRVLIDAVEEHSDQSVSASLVSDLIQIHSSLAPVLKKCDTASDHDVLMALVNELEKQSMISVKILQCSVHVHSLKGLYKNVANREEMTKEIIMNCLDKGVFKISLDEDGICQITMSYEKDENNLTEKSMSELHDLRSRAHLILSAVKKPQTTTHNGEEYEQEINYADFIEQVNILSEIEQTILNLRSAGSIMYQYAREWEEIEETKDLQELANVLREELDAWEKSLHEARQKYYFLNYYWSNQLCILYNFLTDSTPTRDDFESVLTLIHFVDPTINEEKLRKYKKNRLEIPLSRHQEIPDQIFTILGNGLNEIFADTRPVLRNILDDVNPSFRQVSSNASVRKGELYVAVLDEQNPLTVNVMMTLYENTTNGYPEPYQVIFCGPHTTWEEIQIFLQRCFYQTTYLPRESLFCLANVELLTNEIQFQLIEYIKKQDTEDLDYQLAIICRCGGYHHIVEEFSKSRHSISGMSYTEVAQRFRSSWPDVKFVTSSLPGLGKTEFIREETLDKGMNVVTFPISGQFDQSKIIQRLQQLDLQEFQCLHFDVGEVDDPILLDTFLFQLIVTRMFSFGTQRYSLQNIHVYIEIANSLNDRLSKSVVISKCFTNVEIQWKDFDDLEVSSKINSDIQVVCQYLNALERGLLEFEDIHFTGQKKVQPVSGNRCRELLRKYYSTNADTTFTALNTFLGLLANQLRKFSRSAFFEVENLKLMLEDKASGVRRNLLTALLEVSKDFATRALKTCSSSQQHQAPTQATVTSALRMVQRVEGMIQWESSNHLLIVFHGAADSQTIAAFYRDKNRVPPSVSELLKSQIVKNRSKELDDFQKMSHEELHERLERIARTNAGNEEHEETVRRQFSGYALTPDNMLKMILIILRVRANVPIIIMGETGCGKTSLVEYLAETCQIPFRIFNIHAGRTEEEIKTFIEEKNEEARKGQIWVFLDEINTCHHLGMINEIMCHHTLHGQPLSKKLVLLAACNPYKLRPEENATTAGLQGKNVTDEYSELVYRVHQLPEAMVDYVWDYGSLTSQDEKKYIERMVQKLPTDCQRVLVELLAESQDFIRKSEKNPFCVSLRDVRRCIVLVEWFIKTTKEREKVMREKPNATRPFPAHLKEYEDLTQIYNGKPEVTSVVLALAHCYLSRLQTDELRQRYIKEMAQRFPSVASTDQFSAIIRMEQEDYLDRMELPPGTARNAALRENVFVMLVSILNRIPVFVVGKPGCSKSLAIQLIRSNLRGEDSIDPFFKTLPHLYVVSYQGSESSTSEGINQIFEKALNYKDQDANVLPVVLLDEVGLAENSPNNPLKVLHSILEPGKGELPDVAVVGISNWALDAAKMNRAIHLSRPEPTVKDLAETAVSLYQADGERQIDATTSGVLNFLADAYHEYQSEQGHPNFHGLRDYYSLVKSLRNDTYNDVNEVNIALQRNFGGIPVESSKIQEIFMDKFSTSEDYARIPVTTLIQANLVDLQARHLMLITNGDSAIGILKQNFSQSEKETITIFGSRFEEDMSDDYNYRMLSRIILCMERECILILRDLECIYGSLYDMLNQNYSVVGKRKNCRVALGANSNPMCYVNDGFRCIVLVDHDKVDFSDPPFLNRFEKQLLRFSDVLNEDQQEIITELESWVEQMSSVEDLDEQFKESDMFMGFHDDTLPSLVLLHSKDTDDYRVISNMCKDDLMWIATTDGVLRTQKCEFMKENPQELKMLTDDYFEKPIHHGLSSFIEYVVRDQQFAYSSEGEFGSKTVVMTYATVHSDIAKYLDPTIVTYQLERLGYYKSEKQLEDRIHNFFFSDKVLLVFQCKPELDSEHMLLARSIIEDKRKSYVEEHQGSNSSKLRKHVCIIVHVRRAVREETTGWQFNFLSGWKQVFLDALDVPSIGVNDMRNETIDSLFSSSVWSFQRFAVKCILWCFNCIKYIQNERPREAILQIAKKLFASEKVTSAFQKLVLRNVDTIGDNGGSEETWQVKVACDIELLLNSSTLSSAMEQYLSFLIRQPLAKIVYFLERENAWPPHVFSTPEDTIDYEDMWCDLLNSTILDIAEIPESHGAETYFVGGVRLNLRVPFSQVIFHSVDSARGPIMREYAQAIRNESNFDENGILKTAARLEHLRQFSKILSKLVPCVHKVSQNSLSSYMADVFEMISADFNGKIGSQQCISFSMCAFLSFAKHWLPIEDDDPHQFFALLHLFAWTSSDKTNCLFELVNYCQELISQKKLEKVTREFFLENQNVLPFPAADAIDERFDALRTKIKSSGSESKENDRGSNDDDSNDSDDSDSDDSDSSYSDDSDSSYSDEEEDDCFEDILVAEICEKMFPSERTVTRNGGLDSWIQSSSDLLSLALKVSNETPAYHFLRLCVDYAEMVVQKSGKCENYLYVLNEIARKLEPDYLDADSSFQKIKKEVIDPVENHLRGEEGNHVIFQTFLAQFYNRFPEANAETKSARAIIEHVLSLHGEEVLIMTPVIYRLLFSEEDCSPGIFIDIILDQKVGDSQSNLKDIDEVFKANFAIGRIHHDSYPAVMICDLIHFIQNFDKHFNIKQLRSPDSKLLKCFRSATNLVTGSDDNIGLVLLSSVAFLRAFYSMLSKKPSILTSETEYSHVLNEINSLLAGGGARRSALQIFFLKQLYHRHHMTMFDLRKLCCESVNLPVIKNQMEQCKIPNKVELVSVYRLEEYEDVKAAFLLLTEEEMSIEVMKKCKKSANHRLALLGILINEFFVKKAVGNLSDKEERLADWFRKNSKGLPPVMKELLVRIVGRKKFSHHGLQISLESSTYEIDMALLILHVSCVVASGDEGEISPLFQYFSDPKKCHGRQILAHGEDRKRRVFQQFTLCNESTESKEWEECTANMSASVYRALDMIVYACFYAGIATGISSNEDVFPLLPTDEQGPSSGGSSKDSANFCFNRIKDDLQFLMTILSCSSRTAVDIMHLLVEESTDLIRGRTPSDGNFLTRRECLEWENTFTNVAGEILPKALGSARQLKETRMEIEGDKRFLVENQIEELDEYPSDSEQQNKELKRLFRVTKQPSFTELRSIYLNFFDDFQEHRVLAVLLSKFDELPYLTCLFPLVKWSRLVSSTLTNRISRKEAQSKLINDFITGHLLQQERSEEEISAQRENFNHFKDAWNKMREFVNQNSDRDQDEMPYLTEESCIGYCLTEGDLSIYLQTAIKILQSIQNNILDEITLASGPTRHPAPRFLRKNKNRHAISSVSLQEATEKDIINFNWSDKFLRYAQNPNYGFGKEIDYDFERIEEELADEIVSGKCHLTESVKTFIFAKELFHSSAKVLTKIREFCSQSQSLPEEICHSLKESRKQDARTLLQHIEIVIYLLNIESIRTEDVKKITLVKFVEMWDTKLPNPFPVDLLPEPKASIQLTHIAALYEALEDLLADGAIEGLPRQYNVKLTEETKTVLNSLVDNRKGSLKLKLFLATLRRFVFRYLSVEKFLPESHTPLRSCLMEPSLWSPEEAPASDVIPGELRLENIYAIIKHLDQELKEHSSARLNPESREIVLGMRRRQKRRVIAKFSR